MLSAARSVVFAMLVTAGVVTLVVYTRRGEAPDVTVKPDPERPTASAAELKHAPVGSAGCLAAACHGAPAEKALRREYDTFTWQSAGACWTAADPHTAAYFVLTTTDDDTKRGVVKVSAEHIMRNLHRDEKTPPTLATEDVRCVACHTNPALAAKDNWDKTDKIALRSEGVSCEACHGAAGGWQGPHYSSAFKNAREASYKKHGMAPLYDMGERAIACAGCHVGAPAVKDGDKELVPVRDMNHDMIAAGHPRLNFDFADFQARLPRHWQEKKRLEPGAPPYEPNPAKVWLVGRAAHAEAACKLLEDRVARAEKRDERTPWPEYAEFNCAACHHTLRAPAKETGGDWRQSFNDAGGRPLGVAPWQPIWPLTSASGLAWPSREKAELSAVVRAAESRPTRAAGPKAKDAAGEMAQRRAKWLALSDDAANALALQFVTEAGVPTVPDWDSAAQLFWARAALARAKWNGGIVTNFDVVRNALRPREGPGETRPRPFPLVDWNELQSGFRGIVPMDE
jgi:hypothetical protein